MHTGIFVSPRNVPSREQIELIFQRAERAPPRLLGPFAHHVERRRPTRVTGPTRTQPNREA